ncbi:MAG: tetratricopeptide repeat protein [Candidatus Aminicenantes bacterium]|nr:tetratricopeptide repeat protein [Candidatus Aminicenantes bacterium]
METSKSDLVFLSYAHDDVGRVREVYEGLKKRKVDVWFDKEDLGTGRWKTQIEKQIPKCRYFIFFVSEASIRKTADGTGFVEEELQTAWDIARIQDEKKFTIVPVRLKDCDHGDNRLSTFQQYNLFPDFEKGLDRLAVSIGGISLADAEARDRRSEDEKLIGSILGKAGILSFSGNYQKAFHMYETVITVDPENHEAWFNKGNVLLKLEKYKEAISAFDKAIEIKPDLHEAWYQKGIFLDNPWTQEEAIAAYEKAIEIEPDFHDAWYNKGNALRNLEKYEEAIQAYDKAIEIKPDDHEAWFQKGLALNDFGKHEEAIAAYDKAIEIKPDDHEAWDRKGSALQMLKKYEEAIQAYDKAIEIKPDDRESWYKKGCVLEKLKKDEEAIEAFGKAYGIKHDDFEAWFIKGINLRQAGFYGEKADKALKIARSKYEAKQTIKARREKPDRGRLRKRKKLKKDS